MALKQIISEAESIATGSGTGMGDGFWIFYIGQIFTVIGAIWFMHARAIGRITTVSGELHGRLDALTEKKADKDDLKDRLSEIREQLKDHDTRTRRMQSTIDRIAVKLDVPPEPSGT